MDAAECAAEQRLLDAGLEVLDRLLSREEVWGLAHAAEATAIVDGEMVDSEFDTHSVPLEDTPETRAARDAIDSTLAALFSGAQSSCSLDALMAALRARAADLACHGR